MTLEIDDKTCIRTGQCYYLYPELFEKGDDDYPTVIVPEPTGEALDTAEEMALLCPSRSIHLQKVKAEA